MGWRLKVSKRLSAVVVIFVVVVIILGRRTKNEKRPNALFSALDPHLSLFFHMVSSTQFPSWTRSLNHLFADTHVSWMWNMT